MTNTDGTEIINFKTSAAAVKRWGGIKDPLTAFAELIKNGYDADATEVVVTFQRSADGSGKIIIRDDGSGMTREDIATKWLRCAGESKVLEPYTPKFSRRRLGAKGIGRFSLDKLGGRTKVVTLPEGNSSQLAFHIDFAEFTDDKDLDKRMRIEMANAVAGLSPKRAPVADVDVVANVYGDDMRAGRVFVFEATIISNFLPVQYTVKETGSLQQSAELTRLLVGRIESVIKETIGPTLPTDRNL